MKLPRVKPLHATRTRRDAGIRWVRKGREYWQQGALAQAVQCAQTALQQGAPLLDAYGLLGDSLLGLRQFEPALEAYSSAMKLDPANLNLRFLCGEALFHLERYAEVVAYLKDLEPGNNQELAVQTAITLGRAQQKLGQTHLAEFNLLKAYLLQPDNEDAICNLAALYEEGGRHALALPILEQAVRTHPHSIRLHYNLGTDLLECGQTARSIEVLGHTLTLAPQHIKAHHNLGLALLLMGNLGPGWVQYAWRLNRQVAEGGHANWVPETPLLPMELAGCSIRVVGEQGIGDELFFMRYLPALRARGARVLYRLHNPKLLHLLSYLEPSNLIDAIDSSDTVVDITLLAGDLPQALGEYQMQSYPPPLRLHTDAAQVKAWKTRCPLLNHNRPRVGIAWRAGTVQPQNPIDSHRQLSKTMPLDALMHVLAPLPVDIVVLQRHPSAEELQYIAQRVGSERLLDASPYDSDLVELLALLSLLDGLVGVSNTNVHLAAGLGKAIETLVPLSYEFRWQAQGQSTPWFPGAGVYRQQLDGGWQAPLEQLHAKLLQRFNDDHDGGHFLLPTEFTGVQR